MHPETAMEKYMNLLSEVIPGWLGNEISVNFFIKVLPMVPVTDFHDFCFVWLNWRTLLNNV
jgi:hypothetical protein